MSLSVRRRIGPPNRLADRATSASSSSSTAITPPPSFSEPVAFRARPISAPGTEISRPVPIRSGYPSSPATTASPSSSYHGRAARSWSTGEMRSASTTTTNNNNNNNQVTSSSPSTFSLAGSPSSLSYYANNGHHHCTSSSSPHHSYSFQSSQFYPHSHSHSHSHSFLHSNSHSLSHSHSHSHLHHQHLHQHQHVPTHRVVSFGSAVTPVDGEGRESWEWSGEDDEHSHTNSHRQSSRPKSTPLSHTHQQPLSSSSSSSTQHKISNLTSSSTISSSSSFLQGIHCIHSQQQHRTLSSPHTMHEDTVPCLEHTNADTPSRSASYKAIPSRRRRMATLLTNRSTSSSSSMDCWTSNNVTGLADRHVNEQSTDRTTRRTTRSSTSSTHHRLPLRNNINKSNPNNNNTNNNKHTSCTNKINNNNNKTYVCQRHARSHSALVHPPDRDDHSSHHSHSARYGLWDSGSVGMSTTPRGGSSTLGAGSLHDDGCAAVPDARQYFPHARHGGLKGLGRSRGTHDEACLLGENVVGSPRTRRRFKLFKRKISVASLRWGGGGGNGNGGGY